MDPAIVILSQTNLKNMKSKKMMQMNLFIKQKQTHRLQKQTYSFQKEMWVESDKLGVWD